MEINRIETYNKPSIVENSSIELKRNKEDEELKDVCKEFESIFVSMILKKARDSVPDSGLVEKSFGEEIFEDMLINEVSKEVVDQDSHLAKMMYDQFTKAYISI